MHFYHKEVLDWHFFNTFAHNIKNDSKMSINIEKIREDFPILKKEIYGKPLVYMDNAATSFSFLRVSAWWRRSARTI